MKKEVRVVGIDDSPFNKFDRREKVLVVGTIFRGGNFIDGVISTRVSVDGNDSTRKIAEMITKTKFRPQLQAILLKGIAVAGFNVIDIKKLSEKTALPVIVVMRNYPDFEEIKLAIRNVKNHDRKFKLISKAGKIHTVKIFYRGRENIIHVQFAGTTLKRAEEFLKVTSSHSLIPEPLRVAHIIASGIVKGESRGKA